MLLQRADDELQHADITERAYTEQNGHREQNGST